MIKLANINYRRYKKNTQMLLFLIVILSTSFLVILSIVNGANYILRSIEEDKPEFRFIYISSSSSDYISYQEVSDDAIEKMAKINHVDDLSVKYDLDEDDFSLEFLDYEISAHYKLRGVDPKYSTITKIENLLNNDGEELIVFGRDFQAQDLAKVLIEENLILILGLEYNEVIGKKMLIAGQVEAEIIGIYNSNLGDKLYSDETIYLPGIRDFVIKNGYPQPIIVSVDILYELNQVDTVQKGVDIDVDNINNVEEVYSKIEDLTDNGILSSLANVKRALTRIDSISLFLYILIFILFLMSIMMLANAIVLKIREQKDFMRMLFNLGYKYQDILKVYLLDYLQIFFKAVILYLVLALGISVLFDAYTKPVYATLIENPKNAFTLDINSFLIFTSIFAIIFIITVVFVSIVNTFMIERRFKDGKKI